MKRCVMVQGTASDVGKSVLVAGLCRIFMQDGYRCAPFKSQNMALNSGITARGEEMGRAQIFQAEAAGIAPDVRMNPVLLKPTSDCQAQVVLMGKVACNMDAVSYHEYKPQLQQQISEVYHSLASGYDIMVLEGQVARRKSTCATATSSTWAWRRLPMRQCCWWRISTVAGCLPLFTAHWPC